MSKATDTSAQANTLDALWKLYNESRTHCRHYEVQRATLASSVTAISAALIALVTFDRAINFQDFPTGLMIVLMGLLGAFFVWKYFERATMQASRAAAYMKEIDRQLALASGHASNETLPITEITHRADAAHDAAFKRIGPWRIHKLWAAAQVAIMVIGLYITVMACLALEPASGSTNP